VVDVHRPGTPFPGEVVTSNSGWQGALTCGVRGCSGGSSPSPALGSEIVPADIVGGEGELLPADIVGAFSATFDPLWAQEQVMAESSPPLMASSQPPPAVLPGAFVSSLEQMLSAIRSPPPPMPGSPQPPPAVLPGAFISNLEQLLSAVRAYVGYPLVSKIHRWSAINA
jgi:hypothetical protein